MVADFAYKIDLGAGILGQELAVTLSLFAVITVGYRSIRAAFANPANALRTE